MRSCGCSDACVWHVQGAVPPPWQPAEISVLREMILQSGIGQWTEKARSFSTPVRTPKSLECAICSLFSGFGIFVAAALLICLCWRRRAAYYKYISAEIRSLKEAGLFAKDGLLDTAEVDTD